ncbi:hypothetical protein EDB19DRAFT_1749037 [Suillus lakei]|nr:hypothetical protein EDB19DRAFT_1749037 [Suillus lakei]
MSRLFYMISPPNCLEATPTWVEYPDIATVLRDLGIPLRRSDGPDMYTVPILSDPDTGILIDESLEMAAYLEKIYPPKPISTHCPDMPIRAFDSAYPNDARLIVKLIFVRVSEILNPVNAKFFRWTCSERLQLPWEDFSPEGPKHDGDWAYLEQGCNKGVALREKNDRQ